MTINEMIERLKQFDGDMQIVRTQFDGREFFYSSFDGWWPQLATVKSYGIEGEYKETDDNEGEEVLTI